MTSALDSLYSVLIQRIKNANPLWGARVQPLTVASAKLAVGANGERQAYVVFFAADERRRRSNAQRRQAEIMLSVKGVAGDLAPALLMSDALTTLLHDHGDQDAAPALPQHAGWRILTVTEGRQIYIEEPISPAGSIYHAGHQYEIVMEAR